MNPVSRLTLAAGATLLATPALAHVGVGDTGHFHAGFGHPFSGLDHIAAMVAVGLWAALKGGRALWVWPATFVGVMLLGGLLGMLGVPMPLVEPGILASVVVLGLLIAIGADLPLAIGAAIVGVFALFHGHAHGVEAPGTGGGILYLAGFAAATAVLHGGGIAAALGLGTRHRMLARAGGLACVLVGIGLSAGIVG